MTRWLVRTLLLGGVVALALGVAVLLSRGATAGDDDSDEPIVAPSRLRADTGGAVIELDSVDLRRLGVRLAPVRAARDAPEVRLAGELVAEPERVTSVRAPLAGRLSLPPGRSWPGYGDRVGAGIEVAQVSDALPLTTPRAGVVTRVGAQPGEMVAAGQVLLEITDYDRPLARVAWSPDAPPPPARLVLAAPNGSGRGRRVGAALVGAAAAADPVTRLPAYLYRADRGWSGARPGLAVTALLRAGSAEAGVLVPDAAVVQWEGLVWAYLWSAPGRFARRRVATDHPVDGGFLVSRGWSVDDTVVVTGAEQLLSEEFRARVTVGDEQGE
jgi:biotin carboxyl carrier protein